MAAAPALNVVKQIQSLAEGPVTPEMRECLSQVVSSLLFFLDHPDSRVRLSAARTLVKLSSNYPQDIMKLDVSRARSALQRCRKAEADGAANSDSQELQALLEDLLGDRVSSNGVPSGASSKAPVSDPAAMTTASAAAPSMPSGSGTISATEERGQVVLQVAQNTEGKLKAAILEKVVVLMGVVSVTFEGSFVIVATKTASIAADAGFLADLLTAVRAQGLEGVSLVSAANAGSVDAPSTTSEINGCGSPATAAFGSSAVIDGDHDDDDDEGEPAYLDDDEDEVVLGGGYNSPCGLGGGPLGAGGAQWSFFSQSNWMTGRRLQEFGDDPTIAARLAKAKRKEEEKKEQDKSRIGMISSWLGGSRW